jgi:hypothetical protein
MTGSDCEVFVGCRSSLMSREAKQRGETCSGCQSVSQSATGNSLARPCWFPTRFCEGNNDRGDSILDERDTLEADI